MSVTQIFIVSLRAVIGAMEIAILFRVFCELKVVRRDSKPFKFLFSISEPLLEPVRKLLSKQNKDRKMNFDLSPFIVMVILYSLNIILKN
ncbi:MAG: YggT family protein [Clostridiaceae bacterium]|nr:YggT family protein [Clostridiaceae bacterium]